MYVIDMSTLSEVGEFGSREWGPLGPAVGIKTDFYEYPGNDFCNDLNQWTSNLTSTADIPLVHSVSYGWQGNLSTVGCKDADLQVVDTNFAKLAAKGISIMISSGDSGSGYSPQNSQCMVPAPVPVLVRIRRRVTLARCHSVDALP